MKKFAENLRKQRLCKGMTQAQLAEKLGVQYQTVSKWETATTQPDTATLPSLADALDISLDALFDRGRQGCTGEMTDDDREFLLSTYGRMYGPEAGPWNLSVANRYLEYRFAEFFEKHFSVMGGMEFCNIGIGAGEWDRYLSYHLKGGQLTSIDRLETCCRQLEKRLIWEENPNPVRVICADALDLDFREEFDLVTMVGTTGQESGNSMALLKQATAFLKPGGQLYYQSLEAQEDPNSVLQTAFRMGLYLRAFEEDFSYGFEGHYYHFDKPKA